VSNSRSAPHKGNGRTVAGSSSAGGNEQETQADARLLRERIIAYKEEIAKLQAEKSGLDDVLADLKKTMDTLG
jgi:hypothetical protein